MDFMNTTIPSESEKLTGLESQSQRQLIEGRAARHGDGEGALATLMEAALGAGAADNSREQQYEQACQTAMRVHSVSASTTDHETHLR